MRLRAYAGVGSFCAMLLGKIASGTEGNVECPLDSRYSADLIIAYCAGKLAFEVQNALEQHLRLCAKCRATTEGQKDVWGALDSWTPVSVPANFNEAVYRRIAAEASKPCRLFGANRSWAPALPMAAACIALITIFLLRTPPPGKDSPPPRLSLPEIEQVERALDDMDMLKQLSVTMPHETSSSVE